MAIEHADFDGIERLALVLGGDIVSTFDNPSEVKLGTCKLIEEIMIGEDRLIHFSGDDWYIHKLHSRLAAGAPLSALRHVLSCCRSTSNMSQRIALMHIRSSNRT